MSYKLYLYCGVLLPRYLKNESSFKSKILSSLEKKPKPSCCLIIVLLLFEISFLFYLSQTSLSKYDAFPSFSSVFISRPGQMKMDVFAEGVLEYGQRQAAFLL